MRDLHDRTINYMRLSVTDRCNLRCILLLAGPRVPLPPPEGDPLV